MLHKQTDDSSVDARNALRRTHVVVKPSGCRSNTGILDKASAQNGQSPRPVMLVFGESTLTEQVKHQNKFQLER